MANHNNPAGRLLSLFESAKRIDGGKKVIDPWTELLGDESTDRGVLFGRIGKVMTLPMSVRGAIERSELDEDEQRRYLGWEGSIQNAFSVLHFGAQWQTFTNRLDDRAMECLGFCDLYLSKRHAEPEASEDRLQLLRVQIQDLISDICKDSDGINGQLRAYMLKHLEMVERAISDYMIQGFEPLNTAFESLIGSIAIDYQAYQDTQSVKHGNRFWKAMAGLYLLIKVIHGVCELPADVQQLLGVDEPSHVVTAPNGDTEG